MRRRFNAHLEYSRNGRPLLLVGLTLVLILIGHDLVMSGGARASADSATPAYSPAPTSIRTDAFVPHDFHVDARGANTGFVCAVIRSVSTPDRTCPAEAGPAGAILVTMELRGVRPAIAAYPTPSLPSDIRRALLQVFRI